MPIAESAGAEAGRLRRAGLALTIMVGLVLVVVVGAVVLRQVTPVRSAGAIPDYQALPTPYEPPRVAWIGDSYTGGSDMGGRGERNYSAIASRLMKWREVNEGQGGTGYLAGGRKYAFGSDNRLGRLAEKGRYDLIFLVNGFNDYKYPEPDTYAAVRRTFTQLRRVLSPGGKIVVIGYFPLKTDTTYAASRNAELARAAHDSGVIFINPMGRGWLTGQNYRTYIGRDTYHPSDLGHQFLARQLVRVFRQLHLDEITFHRATSYGPLPGITPLPIPTTLPSASPSDGASGAGSDGASGSGSDEASGSDGASGSVPPGSPGS